jgi:putative two-component system response regulator
MSSLCEDRIVAHLAELLAEARGFSPGTARKIRIAAALHDLGKQKIPPSILNKPAKLTHEEMEIMKAHTILGAKMLTSLQGDLGDMVQKICLWHHEFHNGKGYWGKRADELPAYVPLVSVCDVFVALISERPYKKAFSLEDALAYIQSQSGTRFAPALADTFLSLVRGDTRVSAILCKVD